MTLASRPLFARFSFAAADYCLYFQHARKDIFFHLKEVFMKRYLTPIVVLAACAAAAAADLKSGLQVGEAAGYFEVHDVTGPKAGSDLCYR